MRVFLTIAVLAMGLPVSAVAYGTSETVETTNGDQKIVCKHQRKTGTRFTTKICKTAAQWDKIAEAHQSGLKELVDRPQIKICGPSGCD